MHVVRSASQGRPQGQEDPEARVALRASRLRALGMGSGSLREAAVSIFLAAVLSWQVETLNRAEKELQSGRPYKAFEIILEGADLGLDGERALEILRRAQDEMEYSRGREGMA